MFSPFRAALFAGAEIGDVDYGVLEVNTVVY